MNYIKYKVRYYKKKKKNILNYLRNCIYIYKEFIILSNLFIISSGKFNLILIVISFDIIINDIMIIFIINMFLNNFLFFILKKEFFIFY